VSKWDSMKATAEVTVTRYGEMPEMYVNPKEVLELIAIAEKAEEEERPPPPKSKTVVEDIVELIDGLSYDWGDGAFCTRSNLALRNALVSAVEWIEEQRRQFKIIGHDSLMQVWAMEKIAAILRGEKTRSIPK